MRAEARKPGLTRSFRPDLLPQEPRGRGDARRAAPVPQQWGRHPLQARGRPGPARASCGAKRLSAAGGWGGVWREAWSRTRLSVADGASTHVLLFVFPVFFHFSFFKTALLRYNLHITELTFLKRTVQWFFIFSQIMSNHPHTISEHFYHLERKRCSLPLSPHSPPPHSSLKQPPVCFRFPSISSFWTFPMNGVICVVF